MSFAHASAVDWETSADKLLLSSADMSGQLSLTCFASPSVVCTSVDQAPSSIFTMLNTGKLAGKTLLITGASRGIGKAIALKAARDGANVVVAAKTDQPHPKLPGTIHTTVEEIEAEGGQGLACVVDVRDESQVSSAVESAVRKFGGLDILVNNASAIDLTQTSATEMKRFDLMHSVNVRGTFMVTKYALPYLRASTKNPHILVLSPPLNMQPVWFGNHLAYTMSKYGMSMCVLGWSDELKKDGIAANGLWPKTAIMTAAMAMLAGGQDAAAKRSRTDEIMADAAYVVLNRDSRSFSGNLLIDEDVLKEEGVRDFSKYAAIQGTRDEDLLIDLFIDEHHNEIGGLKKDTGNNKQSGDIKAVFVKVNGLVNEQMVKDTNAIFNFSVDSSTGTSYFHVDLKNGNGKAGEGKIEEADVTFSLKDNDLNSIMKGDINPSMAFMQGKLKLLGGDMSKAMKFEKAISSIISKRSFSTLSRRPFSSEAPTYANTSQVFERIQSVASEEIVKQVQAIYLFDVEEEGKHYVDFSSGSGSVGEGEPDRKADVTIKMKSETFLKLFNREITPASAFMMGKIKVSGDLSKALTLEKVMKAAREAQEKANSK